MRLLPRIRVLIVKELLALFRDPRGRSVIIGPPLLQLLIFAFAVTLEVRNVSVVVCNHDAGRHGREIVVRLEGSPTFTDVRLVTGRNSFRSAIDEQRAIAAIHVPEDFSRDIEVGSEASLQVIFDGRRSNAAQIVNSYINDICSSYVREIRGEKSAAAPIVVVRNWFNENLIYLWFTVPSLIGILSMLVTLIVTSLSVARERELGTFDQLLVSPLMPGEILLGKTVPAVIVGMLEGLFIWAAAVVAFRVPFVGSFVLFVFALFIFIMSIVGVGLFISAISRTQQQAILGVFVFTVPVVSLSGYAAPVENMPGWLQTINMLNPLKYFLVTVKGLFLKAMPFADVWANTWPLLIIGALTLSFSGWFFKRRLE